MSAPGTYSFLPWVRQGLGTLVSGVSGQRATLNVQLAIKGDGLDSSPKTEAVQRPVELYGPGDILGIETRAIVKTDPHPWATNFEANYLPFVEFYDEDFPWRYTPASPVGDRLVPWLTLVVLTEDEFADVNDGKRRPLAAIDVSGPAIVFPPADQLWAWAHVHVNRGLAADVVSTDGPAAGHALAQTLRENPDLAYSRIVCPRRLRPEHGYHAFVVPTFESGRLAGLGEDPSGAASATASAWSASDTATKRIPVYHRWYFRTATVGDFEYLVRLLKPRPPDARVGRRPMDMLDPGPPLPPITDASLEGVLQLGGALRVPDLALTDEELAQAEMYERWADPYPHPFQEALADFVNLPDDYARSDAPGPGSADPLITAPIYGRWHALIQRLLVDPDGREVPNRANWVHDLNLDPRFRVSAGMGTSVVQDRQEEYMEASWAQVGQVLEANRTIRMAQAGQRVSADWHSKTVAALADVSPERAMVLTTPVHRRVIAEGVTLHAQVAESTVPVAAMSGAMRRAIRPRGRLVRELPFDRRTRADNLLGRIADGSVTAAPPRTQPGGLVSVDDLTDRLVPGVPPWLVRLVRRWGWLGTVALVFALIALVLLLAVRPAAALWLGGLVLDAAGVAVFALFRWVLGRLRSIDVLREDAHTESTVDRLPQSSTFAVSEPGVDTPPGRRSADSAEATRFKGALRDAYGLVAASGAVAVVPAPRPIAMSQVVSRAVTAIDPFTTFPRRVASMVAIPARIKDQLVEEFDEVMAYPVIDQPMYEPLVARSAELFLPNINLLENNSITLLETNQRFIESYLVGLNHEMARELLWREFPTDQRGTPFRQFWDVREQLKAAGVDDETHREALRDIPPLHVWLPSSDLGDHDNREVGGAREEEVVLTVRGELLKRYPNAVIYAQAAEWRRKGGRIDRSQPRKLVDLVGAEEDDPPLAKVRTPLYRASVSPDIDFIGFDLKVTDVVGGTGERDEDPAGWFFVIKERPGEPRFGLDVDSTLPATGLRLWNELAWEHVLPEPPPEPAFLRVAQTFTLQPLGGGTDPDEVTQHNEDVKVSWSPATNSAELAYVLYQVPVMVAVHAAEMLRERP